MLRRTSLQRSGLFALPSLSRHARGLSSGSTASSTLPHLIFGERHSDPANTTILKELVPELKKMGYKDFYDEVPPSVSLQAALTRLQFRSKTYTDLKIWMADVNLDVDDEKDVAAFFMLPHQGKALPANFQENSQKFISSVREIREARPANLANQNLLECLKFHAIQYRGIDCDIETEKLTRTNMAKRDKQMTLAYFASPQPVFGRVGLGHVSGMQGELFKNNLRNTSLDFKFFHLYSGPAITSIEQDVRLGNTGLPWDIHAIDCSSGNKEEIVAQIKGIIAGQQDLQASTRRMRAAL